MADRLSDKRLDEQFGISSSATERAPAVPCSPEFVRYQAVSYADMREILDSLAISEGDVFLDFGAGMGRAVCLAATYPFRAAMGVEISPELCRQARLNIENVRHKLHCDQVSIVEANAISYPIAADVSVIFFFNPFSGTVLQSVLANIARSFSRTPRPMQVIFYGTVSTERFRREVAQHPAFRLRANRKLRTGARALLYILQ